MDALFKVLNLNRLPIGTLICCSIAVLLFTVPVRGGDLHRNPARITPGCDRIQTTSPHMGTSQLKPVKFRASCFDAFEAYSNTNLTEPNGLERLRQSPRKQSESIPHAWPCSVSLYMRSMIGEKSGAVGSGISRSSNSENALYPLKSPTLRLSSGHCSARPLTCSSVRFLYKTDVAHCFLAKAPLGPLVAL